MKKLILMLAFCASVSGAYAQKTVKVEKVQQETEAVAAEEEDASEEEAACRRVIPERRG